MMKREHTGFGRKIMIVTVLSILVSSPCAAQQPQMKITTWCDPPFSSPDGTGFLDRLLTQAFQRAGLRISIARKPAERSLHDANAGISDGEFIRIEKIGEMYPNLMIVPEHLHELEFVAFTKRDDVTLSNGWKSLESYKVGIVKGWKILEKNVRTLSQRSDAYTQENLFNLLDKGRIDVAVYSRAFGLRRIGQSGLKGIRCVEPPLAKKKMYLFLHKKHQDIIPKITDALKAMKQDGTFLKIREASLPEN